jgi:hypothetical protein
MRRVFGCKRRDETEEWIKLHNEEFHNFTLNQILLGLSNQGQRDERDR